MKQISTDIIDYFVIFTTEYLFLVGSSWLALLTVHHDSFLTCLLIEVLDLRAYLCTTIPIQGKIINLLNCEQPPTQSGASVTNHYYFICMCALLKTGLRRQIWFTKISGKTTQIQKDPLQMTWPKQDITQNIIYAVIVL